MAKIQRAYGWRPDKPDHRDLRLSLARPVKLPDTVDLRPRAMPVRDQASLGSCTGFCLRGLYGYQAKVQGQAFEPSPLFGYYCERVLEGSVKIDAGAEIRDGMKAISKWGICSEKAWPYVPAMFAKKPPAKAYSEALSHQSLVYKRVGRTMWELRACLATGFPITLGFTVYESFESAAMERTGKGVLPKAGEAVLGGHAVLIVGYTPTDFILQNSWGTRWGMKGFFTLPHSYVLDPNLSDDLWCLTKVE